MSNNQAHSKPRSQTILLTAIATLLAADVGLRFFDTKPVSQAKAAMPVAYQPEAGLANPIRQREQMIDELQQIDSRLASLETRLKGNIRVEVMNFPKVDSEKD